MKKFIVLVGIILILNLVNAADVAYIVSSQINVKSEFTDALNRVSLTYEIVYSNQISSHNFSENKIILLDDEYFPNWADIPINDIPALMVNGRNMAEWGWATGVTTFSMGENLRVNLNTSNEVVGSLGSQITVYNSVSPDAYYLSKTKMYSGLEIVASPTFDNQSAVVALARKGTTLTKGASSTQINANGIFFGIYKTRSDGGSAYWTSSTRELFDNCLIWLLGDERSLTLELKEGENLISLPLELSEDEKQSIISNPKIESIKKYSGSIVTSSTLEEGKGYFIKASEDFNLTIDGTLFKGSQHSLLSSGMNLVGIKSSTNIDLDTLPTEIIEVAKRNSDGSYDVTTKYAGVWFNEFDLEPGKGYWFKTNQEVSWTYSA